LLVAFLSLGELGDRRQRSLDRARVGEDSCGAVVAEECNVFYATDNEWVGYGICKTIHFSSPRFLDMGLLMSYLCNRKRITTKSVVLLYNNVIP